jgi:hypothetical protein
VKNFEVADEAAKKLKTFKWVGWYDGGIEHKLKLLGEKYNTKKSTEKIDFLAERQKLNAEIKD